MKRLGIIAVALVFLVVTGAAIGEEEKTGVRGTLQTVEETTEKANTELGYVIGIAAFAPILFTAALTYNIVAAPLKALNDTFDASAAVYKKLRDKPAGEREEQAVEQGA